MNWNDIELRYDAIPPWLWQQHTTTPEGQLRGILQMIRERRAEHTRMIAQWKRRIAEHDGPRADAAMSYAKDLRNRIHELARDARLVRMHISAMAAIAEAKGEGK